MSYIDQQFVEFVVKSLVGHPDEVKVDRRVDDKGVLLTLSVDPEDLGRVIGKRGATAQSLRTLLRALGTKNDARYNLKIADDGKGPAGAAKSDDDVPASADDVTTDDKVSDVVDDPEPTITDEPEAVPAPEPEPEDRLAKTRRELADLDDLDV